jgi:hypothetical protein
VSNRHHPHPVIVDNSKDEHALGAFSQEPPQAPQPEPLAPPSPPAAPPRLMRPVWPSMFGLAALAGVAVVAVTLLSFALGGRAPAADRSASRGSDALPSPVESTAPQADNQTAVAGPDLLAPAIPSAIGESSDQHSAPRADIRPVALPTAAATVGVSGDRGPAIRERESRTDDSLRNTRIESPPLPNVDARPASATVETVIPSPEPASIAAAVSAIPPREARPVPNAPAPLVDAPAPAVAVAPAAAAAIKTGTARTAVESVLQRYATAFSTLDARAAKDVWPSVNESGLARAFSTVKEQQVDLGACDIWVTGPTAVASCEGRTRYTPKVGSKSARSEARGWTFYLEQDGQQWSIASVVTR